MLQPSDFEPHIGRPFRFADAVLVLASVTVTPSPGAARAPFMLIFTGPPGPVLPEGSYDTRTADGDVINLHIMPVHTQPRDRQDYQVVFN